MFRAGASVGSVLGKAKIGRQKLAVRSRVSLWQLKGIYSNSAVTGRTFPPPGWCFMLSVEPIFERAFRMSGAVPGRAAAFEAVVVALAVVVEEEVRAVRDVAAFFSVPVPAVEEGVAGLAVAVRVREAEVMEAELLAAVVAAAAVLGLVESAERRVTVMTLA